MHQMHNKTLAADILKSSFKVTFKTNHDAQNYFLFLLQLLFKVAQTQAPLSHEKLCVSNNDLDLVFLVRFRVKLE